MRTVTGKCGCQVPWAEWGGIGQEGYPRIGGYLYCQEHGDTEVESFDRSLLATREVEFAVQFDGEGFAKGDILVVEFPVDIADAAESGQLELAGFKDSVDLYGHGGPFGWGGATRESITRAGGRIRREEK